MALLAGQKITAYELNAGPATYIPALTGTTTNPTLGVASTATGSYSRQLRRVDGEARITFGTSGVSAGSGSYRISLPISADATYHAASGVFGVGSPLGIGQLKDASGSTSTFRNCTLWLATLDTVQLFIDASNAVSNTVPWTWAASDVLFIQFSYIGAI